MTWFTTWYGTLDARTLLRRILHEQASRCEVRRRGFRGRGSEAEPVQFAIRRAYVDPGPSDGFRVLIDRVWPRGKTKEALRVNLWVRDLAPSSTLCTWFNHDATRWQGFCERYRRELAAPDQYARMWEVLRAADGFARVTLVYGAKDEVHNQAVVLRNALEDLCCKRGC